MLLRFAIVKTLCWERLITSLFLEWENDLSLHEEKSVAATFTPALTKISTTAPDALTLLRVFCFCNPESISIRIFTQRCGALIRDPERYELPAQTLDKLEAVKDLFRSEMRLSKAIQEVQRLSLATRAPAGTERTLRIHDLVHLILRSRLMTAVERVSWLEATICVIFKAFEQVDDPASPRNWNRCGQFVSHIESLDAFAEQYKVMDAELLSAKTSAASYFRACGLYQKATALCERIVGEKRVFFGEKHTSTLQSMVQLAMMYLDEGLLKEAEELGMLVIEESIKALGQEHPKTLTSKINLATIHMTQGRFKEAEELQVSVIKTMTKKLGQEHPKTL